MMKLKNESKLTDAELFLVAGGMSAYEWAMYSFNYDRATIAAYKAGNMGLVKWLEDHRPFQDNDVLIGVPKDKNHPNSGYANPWDFVELSDLPTVEEIIDDYYKAQKAAA